MKENVFISYFIYFTLNDFSSSILILKVDYLKVFGTVGFLGLLNLIIFHLVNFLVIIFFILKTRTFR